MSSTRRRTTAALSALALLVVLLQGTLWSEVLDLGSNPLGTDARVAALQAGSAAVTALCALGLLFVLTRSVTAALVGTVVVATAPHATTLATAGATRPGLLLGVAMLAVLLAFARWRTTGRQRWWVVALVAFCGAELADPGAFALVPLLVLFDLVLFTGPSLSLRLDLAEVWRQRWWHLPFLVVAIAGRWSLPGLLPNGATTIPAIAGVVAVTAGLCGGIAVSIAVAGRGTAECFRELRLALCGALVFGSGWLLPSQEPATAMLGVGAALLWASAGLATVRAPDLRLLRVAVLAVTLGTQLALHTVVARAAVRDRARQVELAREVEDATRKVLPRLVEPLARGVRLRPEFAPVDEQALRALVGRLAGIADPGVRSRDPREDVVLRWRGPEGWSVY